MANLDAAIDNYIVALCLRYYRRSVLVNPASPDAETARDVALLRIHWAMSSEVRSLLTYIHSHRHEVQSLLGSRREVFEGVPRGRIDARATVIQSLTTGNPIVVVADEPIRSYNTGPNQLLVWVIKAAATYCERLAKFQANGSGQSALIKEVLEAITLVTRIEWLREPIRRASIRDRPSPGVLQMASRTRRGVYGRAVSAYQTLLGIEVGQGEVLRRVLATTLCGPLERWRRFELAVALGLGMALEAETGSQMHLSPIGTAPDIPVVVCGPYQLFWQGSGGQYTPPSLEPSEKRLESALGAYGMSLGQERPDIVLMDRAKGRVRAIVEVKYSTGASVRRSFRQGTAQIVRYARGFVRHVSIDELMRTSLVVLGTDPPNIVDETGPAPRAISFAELEAGRLREWLRDRVISGAT